MPIRPTVLGFEGVAFLSKKNCAAKYRHLAPVNLGDQLRTPTGIRLHAEEKVQLCDSCFIQYRTYNEDNQCREIGCRDRGFSVPFDDIIIRVCQKHMQSHVIRRSPVPTAFKPDLFVQDKNGDLVRMDSDEHPVGEMDIGDGVGLSRRENQWRDKQMDNRQKPVINERRQSGASEAVDLDETSSGHEQIRPTKTRLPQHSAPGPRNQHDKSAQSRVSFDSGPSTACVPPRTPRKSRFPPNAESDERERDQRYRWRPTA